MHILSEREHLLFLNIYERSLPDGVWKAAEVVGYLPDNVYPFEWDDKKFLLIHESDPDDALGKDSYKTFRRDGGIRYVSVDSAIIHVECQSSDESVIIPRSEHGGTYTLAGNDQSYYNMICYKHQIDLEDLDIPEEYLERFKEGATGSIDALISIAESAELDTYALIRDSTSALSKNKAYHVVTYKKGDILSLSGILLRKVYLEIWKKIQKSS